MTGSPPALKPDKAKPGRYRFSFGAAPQDVVIAGPLPPLRTILEEYAALCPEAPSRVLLICDEHTLPLAQTVTGSDQVPLCVLESGEAHKDWAAVERILGQAHKAGLGRDSLFIACGGGVVSDLAGFAAAIYMRGVQFCVISTSLLGMVDAALGGKTGCDLFGIKNLAGCFYPARLVYLCTDSLASLPAAEWKSGMAELIKTAVLDGEELFRLLQHGPRAWTDAGNTAALRQAISLAVTYKGRIVEEDPRETGDRRILLNLGHSFGHALESSVGLGRISHGEAVAWGIARSCELGLLFGVTPQARAEEITGLIRSYGYELRAPHPLAPPADELLRIMTHDKKKKAGMGVFVLPAERSARPMPVSYDDPRLKRILNGDGA